MDKENTGKSNNVIKPGNLSTDTALIDQPQGATRFALNVVNETEEGDRSLRSRENSNEPCYTLPAGTIPLGKVYIGNDETLIFLVSDIGDSYFCIVSSENRLTTIITDKLQTEKFGFRSDKQIDATFRLRRGCERTIYFTDPKPRLFIIDKLDKYKNDNDTWNISSFSLFKKYSKIPNFDSIYVEETGALPNGSYNASIQYLDEDLNPTEFITSSKVIRVYNSNLNTSYKEIRGGTSEKKIFQEFGNTGKSITFKFSNLDTNYPFYRLAITECNTGNGEISGTKYTSEIATSNETFTYTGTNFETIGSQAEILSFEDTIEEASSIEQIENTLILADVKGKTLNYCNLQKYASKITADAIPKTIILNKMMVENAKHPAHDTEGAYYMPGEIYSYAIVYIFEDNSLSPALHIPGKSPLCAEDKVFTTGGIPMSKIDNTCIDTQYTDNNSCGTDSLWGIDSEGMSLHNQPVRHHRFPLRGAVNLPFVTKVEAENVTVTTFAKKIKIHIAGNLDTPVLCPKVGYPGYDETCVDEVVPPFQFRITYTVNGVVEYYVGTIDPEDYAGEAITPIVINVFSDTLNSEVVTVVDIEEELVTLPSTITAGVLSNTSVSAKGMTYSVSVVDETSENQEDIYKADVFGIRFSNIELPSLVDTNGYKIIGYYIVRQERTEEEKTVLDSAVLTSMIKNKHFVSHGLLMPELTPETLNTLVKRDVYSFINPEFKFNNLKYNNFNIKQQGKFNQIENIKSRVKTNDVIDGTSFDSKKHKGGRSDSDGWQLQIKTRDNIVKYSPYTVLNIGNDDLKDVFYLPALGDKEIIDSNEQGIDVFNLASDNQIGILSLKTEVETPIVNSLPYVYLTRKLANPYSNFRIKPYYKENMNPIYFQGKDSTCDIFSGDSHITAMKYTNSIFYDNRVRLHAGRTSAWNYIAGALMVAVAVVITVFSAGAGAAVGAGLVGLAAGLVGGSTALIASGIKQDAYNKAYVKLYKEGLKETIEDNYLKYDGDCSNIKNDGCIGYVKNPSDDEIQWLGESVNLWFESKVNMSLRHGATDGTPDFLNAPASKQLGTSFVDWDDEYFKTHSVGSKTIPPTTLLDFHMLNKLTYLDSNRKAGRAYIGIALAELYTINPDYLRIDKQKIFDHLPLEYDCCSECLETFPHRIKYSLQSFQEELTDNFRKFLPNNYKDIEGETGRITDVFRIQNKLYIHTEEALWELPQNYQERVTGEILSFLGTGDYFNIPPRKIMDDSQSSAGNTHKWARLKTKYGVLFPCHKEKKWYLFDGQKLNPISDTGVSSDFKKGMNFMIEDKYYSDNLKPYPYSNNPSHPLGVGYISTYDTKNERFIITKKDFQTNQVLGEDYKLYQFGENLIVFNNYSVIMADMKADGFIYIGIENQKLKFQKTIVSDTTKEVSIVVDKTRIDLVPTLTIVTSNIFLDVDYLVVRYKMPAGATDLDTVSQLLTPFLSTTFGWAQPYHINDYFSWGGDNTGTGLESILIDVKKIREDYPLNTEITFKCKAFWHTNGNGGPTGTGGNVEMDAIAFKGGTMSISGYEFINTGGTLRGNYLFSPVYITTPETIDYKTAQDMGTFIYNIELGQLSKDGVSGGEIANETITEEIWIDVPTTVHYQETETTTITTKKYEVVTEYVSGTSLTLNTLNNGWTMSYSLKDQQWVSYHSYIPSFYFYIQEKFYSWKQNGTQIYRHNKKHSFCNFYGKSSPYIIEYVDNDSPLNNKVYEGILLQTDAKEWDASAEEYLDKKDVTFNKILVYNSHQISGVLNMIPKQVGTNYVNEQIVNTLNNIIIDRNERNWTINELRDVSTSTSVAMFKKKLVDIQSQYYIDKVVNPLRINMNKSWMEKESFRDKFLVIRLIFDTFETTRLTMNFSVQDSKQSER